MKSYHIEPAPKSPGIYALRNTKTGHLYIGQSANLQQRLHQWRAVITHRVGQTSIDFMRFLDGSHPRDWEFLVIYEAPLDKLAELEARAIARAVKTGLCLNKDQPLIPPKPEGPVWEKRSVILGPDGPLSDAQAAGLLGCRPDTVKKRRARFRRRGVFQLKLEDLVGPTASA